MKRVASIVLLALAGLLPGCATDLYSYRGGSGDYYHGEARPDVRIYGGGYYGGYHGYPRYYGPWRYGPSYRYGYYGYPYRYGYGYPYARPWPYYFGPYHPRVRPRHDGDRRELDGSPWRNLDNLRRAGIQDDGRPRSGPAPTRPQAGGDAGPRADGSRFRRAAESAVRRSGRDGARSVEP